MASREVGIFSFQFSLHFLTGKKTCSKMEFGWAHLDSLVLVLPWLEHWYMALSFLRYFFPSSRCSRHENNILCLEKQQQFQQEMVSFLDLLKFGNSLWSVLRSSICNAVDEIFHNTLNPITSLRFLRLHSQILGYPHYPLAIILISAGPFER